MQHIRPPLNNIHRHDPAEPWAIGFGNVPFARDEFTAERITLYVNLDLGQIRGYGLGAEPEQLLVLLALYKLRALVDRSLRLRTACDLEVATDAITARRPQGFVLPALDTLRDALKPAIETCSGRMTVTEVTFNDELKKGKSGDASTPGQVSGVEERRLH